MKINKKAFSFVELIVSIIIIGILSTIGFVSYTSFLGDSRDSQRKSDLTQLSSALKVYKQKRGYYSVPGSSFDITFSGSSVAKQGLFNQEVKINSLDKLAMDPRTKLPYNYSITKNAQEFELSATLENDENPIAIINGTYKSASINILPTISLAIERNPGETAEIMNGVINLGGTGSENRNKFIFDQQKHNIPYNFVDTKPKSDGTALSVIVNDLIAKNLYWQNTDFRSCLEIDEAGKAIQDDGTPVEYQILDDMGVLINTNCTF